MKKAGALMQHLSANKKTHTNFHKNLVNFTIF